MGTSWFGTTNKGFIVWWNSTGLAYKFTFVLGCLIVTVILAAIVKLIIDKATLKKHIKRERAQKAEQSNSSSEQITAKDLASMEEGDFFGVRAIQSGFYGGVAQSAPSSPITSRAPSLYNQPTSPSSPLQGNSPYLPLMHPQAMASPLTSTTSLPQVRSPLGLNPIGKGGQPLQNGPPSPVPSAMLRNVQRPGTSGSNRGFEQTRPSLDRRNSTHSSGTINLDGLSSPARQQQQQQQNTTLRPSASDASDTTNPSTQNGRGSRSRSSSFTSTYSYEDSTEHQHHKATAVKPFEALPTIPVLQPLTADVSSLAQVQKASATTQQNRSPPPKNGISTSELPGNSKPVQRDTNFSAPFRRASQPESMLSNNPEFGPLPAAAMNGGPLQFNAPMRTQSPKPMNMGPSSRRTESPVPLPVRGSSSQVNNRTPSNPREMPRQAPPPQGMQPTLPAFLQQQGTTRTEVEIPANFSNGPRTAPLNKTNSSQLMPEMPKKNRLTADILNDVYEAYSYPRNSKDDLAVHPQGQHFEMKRIGSPRSMPGSPRQMQRPPPPMDRRLV